MSSALDAFIGKLDRGAQYDLTQLHGTCWDEDDVILTCRNCRTEFSMLVRKHHCRSCGGIYCDACNPSGPAAITASPPPADRESEGYYPGKYVGRKDPRRRSGASEAAGEAVTPVAKEEGFWFGKYIGRPNPNKSHSPAQPPQRCSEDGARYCLGCRMGETPCERVKTILKDRYVSVMSSRSEPRPPSEPLTVTRGSLYGETSKLMQRTDGLDAHQHGYIEILNKGDFVFCVKMFAGQSDIYRESCRPSYVPVFPEQMIYAEVPPGVAEVDIAVLYGNKNRPTGGPVVRSVREYLAAKPEERPDISVVSPCASVENFSQIVLYTVDVDGKNAILKYQGQGVLEIRKATTSNLARGAGTVFKGMLGGMANKSTMNMATNTDSLIEVFRCDQF